MFIILSDTILSSHETFCFGKESFPEIIDLFGLEHLHMYDIIVDTVDLFKTGK